MQYGLTCNDISHIGKDVSNTKFPYKGNAPVFAAGYSSRMTTAPAFDWYLKEWMKTLDMKNKDLQEQCGWTVRITNQLINRKIRWHRDHLNLAAKALNIYPYELLIPPEDAMAIRRLRSDAIRIAADNRIAYKPMPELKPIDGDRKQSTG